MKKMIEKKIEGVVLAPNVIKIKDRKKVLNLSNIDVRIHSRVTGKRKNGELIEELTALYFPTEEELNKFQALL